MTTPAEPTTETPATLSLTNEELQAKINEAREQAAKDERDKLYGRLKDEKSQETEAMKAMKAELADLTKAQKAREREAEKAAKDREAAQRKAQEAELDAKQLIAKREEEWAAKLDTQSKTWEQQLAQVNQTLAEERAIREKEQEFSRISGYIQRRLAEEADTIEPRLVKYVTGTTPEEVESSIKQAQLDSADIYKDSERHFKGERAKMPGVAPTGHTPTGPLEQTEQGNREITAEDIKNMSMPEYAEFRKNQGIAASQTGQGLYQ